MGMFHWAPSGSMTPAFSVVPTSIGDTNALNGTGVDVSQFEGTAILFCGVGAVSSGESLAWTVEHSDVLGSNYAAVPADALFNPATGAAATFTAQAAANASQALGLKLERCKKYVRLVATVTGSGVTVLAAGVIIGSKKYN